MIIIFMGVIGSTDFNFFLDSTRSTIEYIIDLQSIIREAQSGITSLWNYINKRIFRPSIFFPKIKDRSFYGPYFNAALIL